MNVMPRYPTRMTPTDWLIAVSVAVPIAVFLLCAFAVRVFG